MCPNDDVTEIFTLKTTHTACKKELIQYETDKIRLLALNQSITGVIFPAFSLLLLLSQVGRFLRLGKRFVPGAFL